MADLQRSKTTAAQIIAIEDGNSNPLRKGSPPFSSQQKALLKQRRNLPVHQMYQEFLNLYQRSQVVILSGDTGSGKSTQIPQFAAWDEFSSDLGVVCTQLRRIATKSIAKRVAEEMDVELGKEVGYHVRGDKLRNNNTRLIYMTEGILVKELITDRNLSKYACVIIDDAHERTVNTDVLLALLKKSLSQRSDLKVIVMSATLDIEKFEKYFDGAPQVNIPGRSFPVDIAYLEAPTVNYMVAAVRVAKHIHKNRESGDILIFMTGEDEIERTVKLLKKETENLEVIPLYSALPVDSQRRAFEKTTARKCIVATNIAETSITIDGIVYVIDTGLSKQTTYNPRVDMEILAVAPISKASANQRAGRAGRTRPGRCYRLYTKDSYERVFPASSQPGILSTHARSLVLTLMSAGETDLTNLGLLTSPHPEVLLGAIRDLSIWEYIDRQPALTAAGSSAANLPVEPEWFRAISKAADLNCAKQMVVIAALASTQQSIFLSPHEHRHVAHDAKATFAHPLSDHLTGLNAFHAYSCTKLDNKVDIELWCADHFLNLRVLEEVGQIQEQLVAWLKEHKKIPPTSTPFQDPQYDANIRKALAQAFCNRTAIHEEGDVYRTVPANTPALLHSGSALVDGRFEWVVYHTFQLTGKQYLKTVTAILPEWLVDLPRFQDDKLPLNGRGDLKQPFVKASLDQARGRIEANKNRGQSSTK